MSDDQPGVAAAAFAAHEAIRSGAWDDHLSALGLAVQERLRVLVWLDVEGPFLTIREAGRALHVHPNTIRNWIDAGELQAITMPGKSGFRRVPVSEIKRIRETQDS